MSDESEVDRVLAQYGQPEAPQRTLLSQAGEDMRQRAARPNWGDTRWVGPEGYNYLPLPAYNSNIGEFLANAVTMGPLALGSRAGAARGNDAVWAHGVSGIPEATPYLNPNMPGMQSVPPRVTNPETRASVARGVHMERDINSLAARANALPDSPEKLRILAEIRDQASSATSGRMTSQQLLALEGSLERLMLEKQFTQPPQAANLNTPPSADWRVIQGGRSQYAEGGEVSDILAQYGQGFVAPQLNSGDGEIADTAGILGQYSNQQGGGLPSYMRALADKIKGWSVPNPNVPVNTLTGRERGLEARGGGNQVPLLAEAVGVHMPAGALETAANWLDWTPRVGQDTLAPLGLAGMVAPAGALASGAMRRTPPSHLPMDEASRLARAREMGFDVDNPMYHGTKMPVEAFDLRRAGVSDPGLVGRAVYGAPDAEQAGMFAMSPHYGRGDAPNVMPLYHGMRNPAIIQDGILPDGRTLTEAHPRGITRESADALNRELKAAGYDGAIFRLGDEVTQYAVFDPTRVRSTRADFDPAQRRSPTLLAAENTRASLPGTIVQGLETSTSRPDADQILRQYSQGPQMSAPMTKGSTNRVEFTPDMRDALRTMYQSGVSEELMSERLGVARQTLRNHWPQLQQEMGLETRQQRYRQPAATADELAQFQKQGLTIPQIAERIGLTPLGTRQALRRNGLTETLPPRPEGILDRVGEMRREGLSYGEIGKTLGLTRSQVAGMVRDLRAQGVAVPAFLTSGVLLGEATRGDE